MHHSLEIKMNKDDYILLLQIIDKNGNLENLHKQGFQYSQIARYISEAKELDHVQYSENNGFTLTSMGRKTMLSYNRDLKRKNSEMLISPQKEYILKKVLSKYDIYLPKNKKDLE